MTTNTPPPTELKELPEVHRIGTPDHPSPPPPYGDGKSHGKPRKRGIIWGLFLLIIAGVTGYAVWRAGQPGVFQQPNQQGNGRGRGKGRNGGGGGLGAVPVVTAKAKRADVPVYDPGLGNVVAFYT